MNTQVKCFQDFKRTFVVYTLSPPQRPPTVAPWEKYNCGARRLGRGKLKRAGKRSRSRFFLWCLLTGASAEERGLHSLVCSRRSDSGARGKNRASERAGKKPGETGEEEVSPRFFPALSLAFFLARAPLSERLVQAIHSLIS